MHTVFIEATQGATTGPNHGKFMVARFDHEWFRPSAIPMLEGTIRPLSLLRMCGWTEHHLWVCDLQTGEGAFFRPGGLARADLERNRIWVCPMFEPFLTWLYTQDLTNIDALPNLVELPDAPFAMQGYRRPGP